jgi:hypothetical protein
MGEIFGFVIAAIASLVGIFDKLHAPWFLGAYLDIIINRDNLGGVTIGTQN